jgi:hypothetical protein
VAVGLDLGQVIDQPLMALVAPMEPFQGQDRAGAIPQQALEATAVAGRDQDRGIDREAPGVRPLQHLLDDRAEQKITALEQTQHSPARALLHISNCLRAKCTRVETYAPSSAQNSPSVTQQW